MKLTEDDLKGVFIGAVTGFLSGLMGIGGGVVMVPLMTLFLHMPQHLAHGTSLAAVLFTGLVSALAYSWNGSVNLALAVQLAAGTIVGARLGALWCNRVPAAHLRRAFGLLLVLVGLRMVIPLPGGDALVTAGTPSGIAVTLALGLIIGVLSGLMGVGGGIFLVPAMVFLLGIAQQEAQGISLAVVVPVGLVGGYTHYRHGNVAAWLLPWLAGPAVLTSLLGTWVAHGLSGDVLRQGFGLLLLFVGVRMAWVHGAPARAGRPARAEAAPTGGHGPVVVLSEEPAPNRHLSGRR